MSRKEWTKEELDFVKANYKTMRYQDIADKLGRGIHSIKHRIRKLKLYKIESHNGDGTKLYRTWHGIRQRANNPNYKHYHHYGGRNIKVSTKWQKSFIAFRDYCLSIGYNEEIAIKQKLQIDRIDNNIGYIEGNIRFVTCKINNNNKNNNRIIQAFGEEKTLSEWAEQYGMVRRTLWGRLNRGMDIETALTTVVIHQKIRNQLYTINNEQHSLVEWCKIYNIKYPTLSFRMNTQKQDLLTALTTPVKGQGIK